MGTERQGLFPGAGSAWGNRLRGCGLLALLAILLPLSLDARFFGRAPAGAPTGKPERPKQVESEGYLRLMKEEDVKIVVPYSQEKPVVQEATNSSVPSFSGFVKEMKAQIQKEKEAEEPATETAAKPDDSEKNADDSATADSQQGQPASPAPTREIVASTDSGQDSASNYVFPRPNRDPVNVEDLFLYFPIQAGEMQMLGLNVDIENNSQFTPPQPMGLKSSAVFERIKK